MRILYVIDSLVPAGAERSLATMAPAVAARGVDLDVARLLDRPGLEAELRDQGITVHTVDGDGGRLGSARRLAQLIRASPPDLVHTTLFEADVAGRLAAARCRVPVVSSLVNTAYGPEHFEDPRLKGWRLRAAQATDAATARLARRLHAVSGYVADVMAQRLRYPRERIDVVHRGRDPVTLGLRTDARQAAARRRLGVGDAPLVVVLARHEYQKGLDVLMEAVPQVVREAPQAQVVVAGRQGAMTDALEKQIGELGLSGVVHLLGERNDVPELLCAAGCFVLCSRREGFPGSVVEAMALEAPVVVSDLPQTRDIVDESMAHIVPVGDASTLAAAVVDVLGDPDAAARGAALARTRFEARFTTDRMVDGMIAFWERSLKQPSA